MSGDLVVSRSLVIPERELRWRFSRSSGPGGQSVNTTDSRVELTWDPRTSRALTGPLRDRLRHRLPDGPIVVTASAQRSQWQNRRDARARLADLLRSVTAAPPPVRRPTRPSRAATERRLAAKRRRSQVKRLRRADEQ